MCRLVDKLKAADGVSILEVLIALIILSVALLMMLNLAMVALDGNDWANNATTGVQLIQQKLEEVRTMRPAPGVYVDTAQGCTRTTTITGVTSHLNFANVVVTWEDVRGHTKADSIQSLIMLP